MFLKKSLIINQRTLTDKLSRQHELKSEVVKSSTTAIDLIRPAQQLANFVNVET